MALYKQSISILLAIEWLFSTRLNNSLIGIMSRTVADFHFTRFKVTDRI